MVNSHSKSFFGQNTGLILTSWSKFEPYIIINCIKLRPNGTWEKLSENEGVVIKISLEEMVSILNVLNHQNLSWQTSHTYKEKITSISFSWQDSLFDAFWININNYSKMLNGVQTEILRLLLMHILHEKIIYSTSLDSETPGYENNKRDIENSADTVTFNGDNEEYYNDFTKEPFFSKQEEDIFLNDVSTIESIILNETEKALKLKIGDINVWVPKSTIHNHYEPLKGKSQQFLISNWILRKNKIDLY